MLHTNNLSQRGVTLIEALVAMAVMAFGMLAVVGVQTTLRVNSDLAKQRTEATRLAEEELETLRRFVTVSDFDNAALAPAAHVATLPDTNTSYTLTRLMVAQSDGLQRTVKVTVSWQDRYGNGRSVVLRDIVTRSAPVLSGLVSSVRKITVAGQRNNRHPTIPSRAGDLGNQTSGFKPTEGGTVAWVFNNTTGVITSICTVVANTSSSSLTGGDLSGCVATNAQLLAGYVRFNFRGVSLALNAFVSAYKPVPGDVAAYIIANDQSRITSRCIAPEATPSKSLTLANVSPCTTLSTPQNISPFDPAESASYSLVASDSDDPRWPALNLSIGLTHDATLDPVAGHTHAPECFADAPTTSIAAVTQTVVQYFCIVYPKSDGTNAWIGRSNLTPLAFTDGTVAAPPPPAWPIGTVENSYRVCRYTPSVSQYAANVDHPADYGKWVAGCSTVVSSEKCRPVTGNLINQNFLVIEGSKTCPTDVPVDVAAGNLVNTNTRQHQP
jgi:Tfp pilus assembly protein PilV